MSNKYWNKDNNLKFSITFVVFIYVGPTQDEWKLFHKISLWVWTIIKSVGTEVVKSVLGEIIEGCILSSTDI